MTETRECRNCHRRKPLSEFPIYHAGQWTGHRHICSKCKYFQDLAWIDDNKKTYRVKRAAYMSEYRKTHPRKDSRKRGRLERILKKP